MNSSSPDYGDDIFSKISEATKEALLSFTVWMVGATLTAMCVAVCYIILHGSPDPACSMEGVVRLLHKSGKLGTLAGLPAGIIVALTIHDRGNRPPLWVLLVMSIMVTLATGALIWGLMMTRIAASSC